MKNYLSYSKLETFNQCPYKYRLIYVDKHFINQGSIATDFGTLIHYIEEKIANTLKENKEVVYSDLINLLHKGDLDEDGKEVKGFDSLKELYKDEISVPDKNNRTYLEKFDYYIKTGIFRLEKYLKQNSNLEIIEAEKSFDLDYKGYTFHGFIDRIFRDKVTNEYIIEDIKTYSAPLDKEHLTTPLQFVIYAEALKNVFPNCNITCAYDLPLCDCKQQAGTKGFVKRGFKKIDTLLNLIEARDFKPNPTPLCYWCIFSETYPNQPEEAKKLCPYYCHWTKNEKNFEVENEWMGPENHKAILESFINSRDNELNIEPEIKVKKTDWKNIRIFLTRT